jgi:FixJ family two-component response regulator
VAVILVTGFGDIMEATDGQPAGVDLILTKPVSMAVLRETLSELTGQPAETLAAAPQLG